LLECHSIYSIYIHNFTSTENGSKNNKTYTPGDDNEEVESVPTVRQVRVLTDDTHRQHFDEHLNGEVGVDGVVSGLEDVAARSRAWYVGAWLIQTKSHAVQ